MPLIVNGVKPHSANVADDSTAPFSHSTFVIHRSTISLAVAENQPAP
jgi:hypothetical protein